MRLLLVVSLLLFLIPIASSISPETSPYGLRETEPIVDFGGNYTINVNSSNSADIWVTTEGNLDDVSDIFHNWLSNLAWSVAGHTMDADLDMNNNNIIDINRINATDWSNLTEVTDGLYGGHINWTAGAGATEDLTTSGTITGEQLTSTDDIDMAGTFTNVMGATDTNGIDQTLTYTGSAEASMINNIGVSNTAPSSAGVYISGMKNTITNNHIITGSEMFDVQITQGVLNTVNIDGDHTASAGVLFIEQTQGIYNQVTEAARTLSTGGASDQVLIYGIYNEVKDTVWVDYDSAGKTLNKKFVGMYNTVTANRQTLTAGTLNLEWIGERISVLGDTTGTTNIAYGIKIDNVQGADTHYGIYDASGADWVLDGDNQKFILGEGQDASIYYDGSDLQINAREVGSGNLILKGDVLPNIDSAFDLGATGTEWANGFFDSIETELLSSTTTATIQTLNVNGDTTMLGDLNASVGNTTINNIYGEMWMHNLSINGALQVIASQDKWENITVFNQTTEAGQTLNGFEYIAGNQPSLVAQIAGKYLVDYSLSFDLTDGNNDEFQVIVAINGVQQNQTETHRKISTAGDVGNTGSSGFIDLIVGDVVTLQIYNSDSLSDAGIHATNLHLMRIGI